MENLFMSKNVAKKMKKLSTEWEKISAIQR